MQRKQLLGNGSRKPPGLFHRRSALVPSGILSNGLLCRRRGKPAARSAATGEHARLFAYTRASGTYFLSRHPRTQGDRMSRKQNAWPPRQLIVTSREIETVTRELVHILAVSGCQQLPRTRGYTIVHYPDRPNTRSILHAQRTGKIARRGLGRASDAVGGGEKAGFHGRSRRERRNEERWRCTDLPDVLGHQRGVVIEKKPSGRNET